MEYKRIEARDKYAVDKVLNNLSENGWELQQIIRVEKSTSLDAGWHIFVKRTKTAQVLYGDKND